MCPFKARTLRPILITLLHGFNILLKLSGIVSLANELLIAHSTLYLFSTFYFSYYMNINLKMGLTFKKMNTFR